MIKWNCNFNIEDSSVQVDIAYVIIEGFVNRTTNCKVNIKIVDESNQILIKQYDKIIEGIYNDEDEIYPVLLNDFENAEVV